MQETIVHESGEVEITIECDFCNNFNVFIGDSAEDCYLQANEIGWFENEDEWKCPLCTNEEAAESGNIDCQDEEDLIIEDEINDY